jgi:cytochrome c553
VAGKPRTNILTIRGQIMKVMRIRLSVHAAILAAVVPIAGHADSAGPTAARHGVSSKVEYCTDCHGVSGRGYHGFYTMPRLAGQTPEYIEDQLRAFVERRRDRNIVINMARIHGVSPGLRSTLATHFSELNPRPFGGGPRQLVATGRKIYQEGVPEANVPACAACHGPDATGKEAIPRLAGQLYPYTVKELTNWTRERGHGRGNDDPSAVMVPIARNLTKSDIAAIAAYLSYKD